MVRCNAYQADLKEWGPTDRTMENTIVLLPIGEVKGQALCLIQKEGDADTPLGMVAKIIPLLKPHLVWRWPVRSGVPAETYDWVEPGTFRNLLARGRQIRRTSGAPGVPQPRPALHE
jgi:hypothetical protein